MKRIKLGSGSSLSLFLVFLTVASVDAAIAPIFGPPGPPPAEVPTNAVEAAILDPIAVEIAQEVTRAQSEASCVRETRVTELHASGRVTTHAHGPGVVELATGLNRRDAARNLVTSEASARFAGGALLVEGLPVAYRFATNVNAQVVVEQRKDGAVRSRSAIAGLVYLDYRSGRSILLAVPQDAPAAWTGGDVVYSNAFGSLDADIVYHVRPSGLEQDVILRSVPPAPATYGLSVDATRLCILTELVGERPDRVRVDSPDERNAFVPSPEPLALLRAEGGRMREIANYDTGWAFGREENAAIGGAQSADASDGTLESGVAVQRTQRHPVDHRVVTIGSRVFLCEEVRTAEVRDWMLDIPVTSRSGSGEEMARLARADDPPLPLEPPPRPVDPKLAGVPPRMQLTAARTGRDYVLDYIDVNQPSLGNYTFEAGQTYRISGELYVDDLTIEPGAVIKLAPGVSIHVGGVLHCNATPARPAHFTSVYDASIGDPLPESGSADPWNVASRFERALVLNQSDGVQLGSLRFRHGVNAVVLQGGASVGHIFRDCEFEDMETALAIWPIHGGIGSVDVRNCLFTSSSVGIDADQIEGLSIQSCTFSSVGDPISENLDTVGYTVLRLNLLVSSPFSISSISSWYYADANASSGSLTEYVPGWIELYGVPFDGSEPSRPYALNPDYAALLDVGTGADSAGLAEYSTRANGALEGCSAVDIGYHYFIIPPAESDNDNDGLTYAEEVAWGTDPNNGDSDGDGWNDGMEVAIGTNPTWGWWYPQPIAGTLTILGAPAHVVVETRSGPNVRRTPAFAGSSSYSIPAAPWYCYNVSAFADDNDNGVWDEGEARAEYPLNDLYLGWDACGIDFTLDASAPSYTRGSLSGSISYSGFLTGDFRVAASRQNAPALQYDFDDAYGQIVDATGNGNAATVVGASWTSEGHTGGAYTFAGDGSRLELGDIFDLDASARPDLTVCAWVKFDDTSGYQDFISKQQDPWPYTGWALMSAEGTAFADFIGSYPERAWQWSTNSFADGGWHFVAGQWHVENGRLQTRLYVDGGLVGQCNYRGGLSTTDSESPLTIGARDAGGGSAFHGTLDDLRIYEAELGADQLAAVASGGPALVQYGPVIAQYGSYGLADLPTGGPYELLGFLDRNGNGVMDPGEPRAHASAVHVSGPNTMVNLDVVDQPDSDGDGMPDDWELANGFDPQNPADADGDADGDGVTNISEWMDGTNPSAADTDQDGLPDGWEDHFFGGLGYCGSDDPDYDGRTNARELQEGTDPACQTPVVTLTEEDFRAGRLEFFRRSNGCGINMSRPGVGGFLDPIRESFLGISLSSTFHFRRNYGSPVPDANGGYWYYSADFDDTIEASSSFAAPDGYAVEGSVLQRQESLFEGHSNPNLDGDVPWTKRHFQETMVSGVSNVSRVYTLDGVQIECTNFVSANASVGYTTPTVPEYSYTLSNVTHHTQTQKGESFWGSHADGYDRFEYVQTLSNPYSLEQFYVDAKNMWADKCSHYDHGAWDNLSWSIDAPRPFFLSAGTDLRGPSHISCACMHVRIRVPETEPNTIYTCNVWKVFTPAEPGARARIEDRVGYGAAGKGDELWLIPDAGLLLAPPGTSGWVTAYLDGYLDLRLGSLGDEEPPGHHVAVGQTVPLSMFPLFANLDNTQVKLEVISGSDKIVLRDERDGSVLGGVSEWPAAIATNGNMPLLVLTGAVHSAQTGDVRIVLSSFLEGELYASDTVTVTVIQIGLAETNDYRIVGDTNLCTLQIDGDDSYLGASGIEWVDTLTGNILGTGTSVQFRTDTWLPGTRPIAARATLQPACAVTCLVQVLEMSLTPDFNRDGTIDETDRRFMREKGLFRIWVNDDRDIGDDASDPQDDSPANSCAEFRKSSVGARGLNFNDDAVNGARDLVDFFPLHLSVPIDRMPSPEYSYRLKQNDNSVRFVYTDLATGNVRRIHTERIETGCGLSGNDPLASAHSYSLDGTDLPAPLSGTPPLSGVIDSQWLLAGSRVLLIEGARTSTAPLILEVSHGDRVVGRCEMGLSVSPVKDMFRYLNARTNDPIFTTEAHQGRRAQSGLWLTQLDQPPNCPDGFFSDWSETRQTLVSIHGLDWDHNETPAGQSEIFKRFFQSGCNARFVAVSWASDMGRIPGVGPANYNRDVIGAFVAAPIVKKLLQEAGFLGPHSSIFAHSLGNVLTSSMIVDHGATVGNYFMIDAAVPIEAYDGRGSLSNQMAITPPEWKNGSGAQVTNAYPLNSFAAYWPELFPASDPRRAAYWPDRFASVKDRTSVFNYHSTGEEILKQPDGSRPPVIQLWPFGDSSSIFGKEFVWVGNEMRKGDMVRWSDPLESFGVAVIDMFINLPEHIHAGWDFRYPIHLPASVPTGPSELITSTWFGSFENSDARCPSWSPATNWIYRPANDSAVAEKLPFLPIVNGTDPEMMKKIKNHAKLLAEAIPALSGPTGGRKLDTWANDRSLDLEFAPFKQPRLWPARTDRPSAKRDRWLHGDYKEPAYLYVHTLYDRCTTSIQGGSAP